MRPMSSMPSWAMKPSWRLWSIRLTRLGSLLYWHLWDNAPAGQGRARPIVPHGPRRHARSSARLPVTASALRSGAEGARFLVTPYPYGHVSPIEREKDHAYSTHHMREWSPAG